MDDITVYTIVFYISLLVPILCIIWLSFNYSNNAEKIILQYLGGGYILFVFLLIAFRPIGNIGFTDSQMYINWFNNSKYNNIVNTKDIGFGLLIFFCSKIMTVRMFFIFCTIISFVLILIISFKIAKEKYFLFVLTFFLLIYFWNHQVFTIRQGLAGMLFLLGVLNFQKNIKFIFCLLAISFHKSFLLPVLCFYFVNNFINSTCYLCFWFLVMILCYFFGQNSSWLIYRIQEYSPQIDFYFNELSYFFRWDIVAYSFIFILVGAYYKYYKKYDEYFYTMVYNLYVFSNTLIMVIHPFLDGFVHRFAYLSWILIPFIVFMPIFKRKESGFNYISYSLGLISFYIFIFVYTFCKIKAQDGYYVLPV